MIVGSSSGASLTCKVLSTEQAQGWYWAIPAETIPADGSYDTSGQMWAGAADCALNNGWLAGSATVTMTATGYILDLPLTKTAVRMTCTSG